MAVGDAVINIVSVPSFGYLTFQPAVGRECLITGITSYAWSGITPDQSYFLTVFLYDGALGISPAASNSYPESFNDMKLNINNSYYLYIYNPDIIANYIGYFGVEFKS